MARNFHAFVVACICAVFATNVIASTEWLLNQQQPDGAIAGTKDISTHMQSTAEALTTLRVLGAGANLNSAQFFLNADTYPSTEHLSRKVGAAVAASAPTPLLIAELLTHQNADGGFGELPGYHSTPLDTAFVLTALVGAGQITTSQNLAAITYLISTQTSGGGWSLGANESSVYVSSYVLEALWPFRQRLPSVVTSAARAKAYLLSQVQANALWGSDFESALALIALAPTQASQGELSSSDVTALALRAIALASAPNANPDLARVTGANVDGDSQVALAGVTVRLNGAANLTRIHRFAGHVQICRPCGRQLCVRHRSDRLSAAERIVEPEGGPVIGSRDFASAARWSIERRAHPGAHHKFRGCRSCGCDSTGERCTERTDRCEWSLSDQQRAARSRDDHGFETGILHRAGNDNTCSRIHGELLTGVA